MKPPLGWSTKPPPVWVVAIWADSGAAPVADTSRPSAADLVSEAFWPAFML